jgi:hypothetical protein
MKILDEISDEENCIKSGNCPQKSGVIFNYIGFMIYMIVVNVLLLNLLIAMFRLYLSFIIYITALCPFLTRDHVLSVTVPLPYRYLNVSHDVLKRPIAKKRLKHLKTVYQTKEHLKTL